MQVYLDELSVDAVRAEFYADPGENLPMARETMTRGQALAGSGNAYVYVAAVPADHPADAFTPRIIPYREGASVPLNAGRFCGRGSGKEVGFVFWPSGEGLRFESRPGSQISTR
jgi:hypothetical protein